MAEFDSFQKLFCDFFPVSSGDLDESSSHTSAHRFCGDVEWPYWKLPPRFYGAQRIAQWRRPSSVAFWTRKKDGAAFRVFLDGQIQHLRFFFGFWMISWILNGLSCKYSWMGLPEVSSLLGASWLRRLAIGATAPSFPFPPEKGQSPISPWKSM